MSDRKRYLQCPGCDMKLSVPASTPAGAKARCSQCQQAFRVPAVKVERPSRRPTATGAQVFDINQFPTELREAIGPTGGGDEAEAPGEVRRVAKSKGRQFTESEASRKAFDLNDEGSPLKRSGVQMVNVQELLDRMEAEKSAADNDEAEDT